MDQREVVVSVRCRFGCRGPRVRSHGDVFGRGEHVAVWVGDVSLTLSAHCFEWDQHPLVPCHTGPVWMVMTRCRDTPLGLYIMLGTGRLSLVLGDDHSHMGGSDDMKSGYCTSGDWVECTGFIFMFLALNWVCTLLVIYVHYIRFILSRVTVYP